MGTIEQLIDAATTVGVFCGVFFAIAGGLATSRSLLGLLFGW